VLGLSIYRRLTVDGVSTAPGGRDQKERDMATYLLAYSGGTMAETEEAQQAAMAAWGAWFGELGDAVVDGGNPFGPSATIGPDGSVSATGASRLTGYSVITADSLDAATVATKNCPVLATGGSVEVYETFEVM
jgi:hypothetical protein